MFMKVMINKYAHSVAIINKKHFSTSSIMFEKLLLPIGQLGPIGCIELGGAKSKDSY